MYKRQKQILVSELVLAESKDKEEIEELVESKINTSYELHSVVPTADVNVAPETPENVMKKFIPQT